MFTNPLYYNESTDADIHDKLYKYNQAAGSITNTINNTGVKIIR